MTSHVPSIPMRRERFLRIDWEKLTISLTEVALQGFVTAFGVTDGISGAISAFLEGVNSVSLDDDAEQKAWQVFILTFAWTLDDLRSTIDINDYGLRRLIIDAVDNVKTEIDNHQVMVPADFISNPTSLVIYQKLRDAFVDRRAEFRINDAESKEDLRARFDSSFRRGIFALWTRRPDLFAALETLAGAPGLAANSFELQWISYREHLRHTFEVTAMFGQEAGRVSLAQIYVPLRCFWKQEMASENGFPPSVALRSDILDSHLDAWLSSPDGENIKLIGGGPGSGKSTSVKRLARFAADIPSIRTLYIPLQHITLEGSLRDSVNAFFTGKTRGSFTSAPLSRESVESGSRLLLIFDGLDEISRPGDGADEIANLFITKLDQLLHALDSDTDKTPKVVVTGRMPSFQAARKFRGAIGSSALEVLGYAPIDRSMSNNDDLWNIDQRSQWWSRYATTLGLDTNTPEALKDARLRDITNEPLLCYLLVLSGFAVDNWEAAAENRNRIYDRLINEVWRRGWGDAKKQSDRQGAGKHLSRENFNALMENIALAAWLGGDTRVATEEKFISTLKITSTEQAWADFSRDDGQDVANLAMNFYLKSSDGSQRGFEFTHKSFGDYLAARSILNLALEISDIVPRYTDAALKTWLDATATGDLTKEIRVYLKDQARIMVAEGAIDLLNKLAKAFETLASTVLLEGLPAHTLAVDTWRSAARQQRNAETMLWAVLNAAISALQITEARRLVDVGFSASSGLLKSTLLRVAIGESRNAPVIKCFSYLKADNSDLFGLDLSSIVLDGGSLRGANLNGTHLMSASLQNCNLTEAQFQRSNLDRCSFDGSDLADADFTDARTQQCRLDRNTVGQFYVSRRTLLDLPASRRIAMDRLKFDARQPEIKSDAWTSRVSQAESAYADYRSANADMFRQQHLIDDGEEDEGDLNLDDIFDEDDD